MGQTRLGEKSACTLNSMSNEHGLDLHRNMYQKTNDNTACLVWVVARLTRTPPPSEILPHKVKRVTSIEHNTHPNVPSASRAGTHRAPVFVHPDVH